MLKRLFSMFLCTILFCLCGCNNTDINISSKTQTTLSETTTQTEDATSDLEGTTAWEPRTFDIWLHNPRYPGFSQYDIIHENYDVKMVVEPSSFSISKCPETISLIAYNQTGNSMVCSATVFLEKLYHNVYSNELSPLINFDSARYYSDAWVRIPFSSEKGITWGASARPDMPFVLGWEKCLQENYTLTTGEYRFVFFTAVGTHYGYFEIIE